MNIHLIAWDSTDGLTVDAFLTKEEAENSLASAMLSYKGFRNTVNHNAMTDSQIIKAWNKWSESSTSDVYVYDIKVLSINTGLGAGIKL